ncbi:MAG: hypothetical protein FWH25_04375, partial [Syntrophorhabdaceae bacterium]|nr:hypothetical protein [Syntrophorhabdaceae bacterium]
QRFRRIGFADRFFEHGTIAEIRADAGVTPAHIAEEALRMCASEISFLPSAPYGARCRIE